MAAEKERSFEESQQLGQDLDFEEIYTRAGDDLDAIPWAGLAPHPVLLDYLAGHGSSDGLGDRPQALVIGCGLGDDAEELAGRGYRVAAFDISPTAIARCHDRFPSTAVDYRVEDLFGLPAAWCRAFDLVVEINTVQSLPPAQHRSAISAIAATARSGGQVLVRCLARDDAEPATSRPWPLSRTELRAYVDAGLRELVVRDEPPGPGHHRHFRALYTRP